MNTNKVLVVLVALFLFSSSSQASNEFSGSVSGEAAGPGSMGNGTINFGGITSASQSILATDTNTGLGGGSAYGDSSGILSIVAHACVEPDPMFGVTSAAGGSTSIGFTDAYRIQSATVPAGTQVLIDFSVIAGISNQNNNNIASAQTSTTNSAQAFFGVGNNSIFGNYNFSQNRISMSSSTTGLFAATQATKFSVMGVVGSNVGVSAQLNNDTTAFVDPGDMGDVQDQAILVWGAVVETSGVTLVSVNTVLNMPDTTNTNPEYVQDNMPPPIVDDPGPLLPGDFNRDGHVDAADILPMMKALTNLSGYKARYDPSLTDPQLLAIGDLNGDGKVNNADLHAFLDYLKAGNGSTSVPEPSTLVLAVLAFGLVILFEQFRHSVAFEQSSQ
jgi:hypothetical protein